MDEHNVQVAPPGFHVIFLPFTDDIRKLQLESMPRGMFLGPYNTLFLHVC